MRQAGRAPQCQHLARDGRGCPRIASRQAGRGGRLREAAAGPRDRDEAPARASSRRKARAPSGLRHHLLGPQVGVAGGASADGGAPARRPGGGSRARCGGVGADELGFGFRVFVLKDEGDDFDKIVVERRLRGHLDVAADRDASQAAGLSRTKRRPRADCRFAGGICLSRPGRRCGGTRLVRRFRASAPPDRGLTRRRDDRPAASGL